MGSHAAREQALPPARWAPCGGRRVPLRGRSIPAVPARSPACIPSQHPHQRGLWAHISLLAVGRRPRSRTLTHVWSRVCRLLPCPVLVPVRLRVLGWVTLVRGYLPAPLAAAACLGGIFFPPSLFFRPLGKEHPWVLGRAPSTRVPLSCRSPRHQEGSQRCQGLKVSRRTSQLFCVICEELGSCQSPSGEQ